MYSCKLKRSADCPSLDRYQAGAHHAHCSIVLLSADTCPALYSFFLPFFLFLSYSSLNPQLFSRSLTLYMMLVVHHELPFVSIDTTRSPRAHDYDSTYFFYSASSRLLTMAKSVAAAKPASKVHAWSTELHELHPNRRFLPSTGL